MHLNMHINLIAIVLLKISLVTAHGKVSLARGNAGGNGTGLGIRGGIVPGSGPNNLTEVDTTVFRGATANACGFTEGFGINQVDSGIKNVMAISGSLLPQVTPGGYLYGILHVVVSDGWGPYSAYLDTTGNGSFVKANNMSVLTQVPGVAGHYSRRRRVVDMILKGVGLVKRTTNVNQDWPFKVAMPSGVTCMGTFGGLQNICIVKFVNPARAGPFGGCIPIQLVAVSATVTSNTDPLATSSKSLPTSTSIIAVSSKTTRKDAATITTTTAGPTASATTLLAKVNSGISTTPSTSAVTSMAPTSGGAEGGVDISGVLKLKAILVTVVIAFSIFL